MKNINIPKVLTKGIFKDKIRIACSTLTATIYLLFSSTTISYVVTERSSGIHP